MPGTGDMSRAEVTIWNHSSDLEDLIKYWQERFPQLTEAITVTQVLRICHDNQILRNIYNFHPQYTSRTAQLIRLNGFLHEISGTRFRIYNGKIALITNSHDPKVGMLYQLTLTE